MRLVGKTLSAAGGQYAVRISAPAALKTSAAPGGIVNLQADVVGTRAGTSLYPFSLRIRSTPSGPVLTRLWVRGSPHGALQTAVLRVSGARNSAAIPQDFCYDAHTSFVKNYAAEWANLDATYMRFSGVKGWVDYETGQDSTFSVGISSSAEKGSFSAGGSYTLSSTIGYTFGANAGPSSEYYQTQFLPALYKITYTPGDCVTYFTQPGSQTGGHSLRTGISIPSAGYCVPETAGATFYRAASTASTTSDGMDISEIGFTASAQTGWSSTDTIYYEDTNNSSWHLCGVHGEPAESPGEIVAGVPG